MVDQNIYILKNKIKIDTFNFLYLFEFMKIKYYLNLIHIMFFKSAYETFNNLKKLSKKLLICLFLETIPKNTFNRVKNEEIRSVKNGKYFTLETS